MPLVVGKRLTIWGFIVSDPDFGPKYNEKNMRRWINDGEITVLMHLTDGIENATEGLQNLLLPNSSDVSYSNTKQTATAAKVIALPTHKTTSRMSALPISVVAIVKTEFGKTKAHHTIWKLMPSFILAPETTLTRATEKNQKAVAPRKIAKERATMRKVSGIISGLVMELILVYEGFIAGGVEEIPISARR
jgi:hypothetical protein